MTTRIRTLDLPLDDHEAIAPGDIIVSARLVQRVTDARPVESRVWGNRWRVTMLVLRERTLDERRRDVGPRGDDIGMEVGRRIMFTRMYRPGERPGAHLH